MNKKIEAMIYVIRGHKVMLDSDLAALYGVQTKILNQSVKRNLERFPDDFLIVPNSNELASLRSQIVTLGAINADNHIFKFTPFLFTENGVAMLSSVLRSKEAIQVNIAIMRTFNKLRSYHAIESVDSRLDKFEKNTNQLFKIILERLDNVEEIIIPNISPNRKKIGLKKDL
jgi:hypothetical protein